MDWLRWMGWTMVSATMLACGSDPATPAGESDTGGLETSGTTTSTSTGDASSTSIGSSDASETGNTDAWFEPPDCESLQLPGTPEELASTPRANRSAELLALTTAPEGVVAPEDAYVLIDADLQAIAALDPELEDIAPTCAERNRFQMWWQDTQLPEAIWRGAYRAWDCHNAHFDVASVRRLDGSGYGFEFDKILGTAVDAAYLSLPGFEDADVSWCWYNDGPCDPDCHENAVADLELESYEGPGSARVYRFVRRTEDDPVDVRYRVDTEGGVELLP